MDLEAARREIVAHAFSRLGIDAPDLANEIADAYSRERDEGIYLLPGAVEALRHFRQRGIRLALVTNGSAAPQRRKIERFGLAPFFDFIVIEGEFGTSKPDEHVYTLFYTNDLSDIDLEIAVLDNGSNDEHRGQLKTYLADQGIPLIQTGFDNSVAPQKHGVALTNFVLENDGCTHYLFLDSDMWFVEEDTIPTMLAELVESPPDIFGCQARISGFYAHRIIEDLGYEFDSR